MKAMGVTKRLVDTGIKNLFPVHREEVRIGDFGYNADMKVASVAWLPTGDNRPFTLKGTTGFSTEISTRDYTCYKNVVAIPNKALLQFHKRCIADVPSIFHSSRLDDEVISTASLNIIEGSWVMKPRILEFGGATVTHYFQNFQNFPVQLQFGMYKPKLNMLGVDILQSWHNDMREKRALTIESAAGSETVTAAAVLAVAVAANDTRIYVTNTDASAGFDYTIGTVVKLGTRWYSVAGVFLNTGTGYYELDILPQAQGVIAVLTSLTFYMNPPVSVNSAVVQFNPYDSDDATPHVCDTFDDYQSMAYMRAAVGRIPMPSGRYVNEQFDIYKSGGTVLQPGDKYTVTQYIPKCKFDSREMWFDPTTTVSNPVDWEQFDLSKKFSYGCVFGCKAGTTAITVDNNMSNPETAMPGVVLHHTYTVKVQARAMKGALNIGNQRTLFTHTFNEPTDFALNVVNPETDNLVSIANE